MGLGEGSVTGGPHPSFVLHVERAVPMENKDNPATNQ